RERRDVPHVLRAALRAEHVRFEQPLYQIQVGATLVALELLGESRVDDLRRNRRVVFSVPQPEVGRKRHVAVAAALPERVADDLELRRLDTSVRDREVDDEPVEKGGLEGDTELLRRSLDRDSRLSRIEPLQAKVRVVVE